MSTESTDDETRICRLVSGNHRQDGGLYAPGDVVELTERSYQAFAFKFEDVTEDDEEPTEPSNGRSRFDRGV